MLICFSTLSYLIPPWWTHIDSEHRYTRPSHKEAREKNVTLRNATSASFPLLEMSFHETAELSIYPLQNTHTRVTPVATQPKSWCTVLTYTHPIPADAPFNTCTASGASNPIRQECKLLMWQWWHCVTVSCYHCKNTPKRLEHQLDENIPAFITLNIKTIENWSDNWLLYKIALNKTLIIALIYIWHKHPNNIAERAHTPRHQNSPMTLDRTICHVSLQKLLGNCLRNVTKSLKCQSATKVPRTRKD